ncbi:MAG: Ca2+-binding RTX toxin-like protein [Myxococcota bacterium]|jgi:Ca2+-binding RTX toxin-like protein
MFAIPQNLLKITPLRTVLSLGAMPACVEGETVTNSAGCAVGLGVALVFVGVSCGAPEEWAYNDPDIYPGLSELDQPLTQLATACTFTSVSGIETMTIVVSNGETALISKRSADSAMLVNGATCGAATSSTAKRIDITGDNGDSTVILDFMSGTFVPGGASPGITIDLGGGSQDSLKIRGSASADTVTFGADGIAFNSDNLLDVTTTNIEVYVVSLGSGNDSFTGSGGRGTGSAYTNVLLVYGGPGNDVLAGGTAVDTLNGGDGSDTLSGAEDSAGDTADDILNGEGDNDTFDCGNVSNGGDVMNGGAGIDHADYSNRQFGVTVTMGAGANDGELAEGDDVVSDVEKITGSANADTLTGSSGDDIIFGGDGNDMIVGGDGDDNLNGGGGNDTFTVGADPDGADTIAGDEGTDTVTYAARDLTEPITVTMDLSADDGGTLEGDNIGPTVENLIGGDGDDTITGNSSANVLTGGPGDDTLDGGFGNDTFLEGSVASGADVFIGGSGVDTLDYSARTGDLTITMGDDLANDGLAGELDDVHSTIEDVLCGSGDDDVTGTDDANRLVGGDGADTLRGGAGADDIDGQDGDDVLFGDGEDDIVSGGPDNDVIDCGAGQGDIHSSDPADLTPSVNCEL